MSLSVGYISVLHSQYFRNSLLIGLKKLGCEVEIYPRHEIVNLCSKPLRDFRNLRKDHDIIIVSIPTDRNITYIKRYVKEAITVSDIPVVILDFSDISFIRGFLLRHKAVRGYFKREVTRGSNLYSLIRDLANAIIVNIKSFDPFFFFTSISPRNSPKIKPIPLGISELSDFFKVHIRKFNERDIDVSFVANFTHPERRRIREVLLKMSKKYDLNIIVKNNIPINKYFEILSRSKISINTFGIGFDTYRFYEILYFKTMLLSKLSPLPFHLDVSKRGGAVFFKSVHEIEEAILEYLEGDWKQVARRGNKILREEFLDISLAKNFIRRLKTEGII